MVYRTGVTSTTMTATGLTGGLTYKFKIESRNIKGFSPESSVISILAAGKPETPLAPTTSVLASNVIITWVAPFDNYLSITGYRIKILQ